jgi:hypothetical protein
VPPEHIFRCDQCDFDVCQACYNPAKADDEELQVGSIYVREAARMQRRFMKRLSEQPKPRAVWLRLDPLTGDVSLYPSAAASRLEAAHHGNRTTVPLAGLGKDLEDSIVHLGGKGEHPVQKTWHGELMDVRRMVVQDTDEIRINVAHDNGWHIVDGSVSGQTEERRVSVRYNETTCCTPSQPLPPVHADRGNNFNLQAWGSRCMD